MIEKLFDEFIDEIKSEGTYASKEELREATKDILNIINNNKDATAEELVELIIKDNIRLLEEIRNNYSIPGYTVGVNVGRFNIKMKGGSIDGTGRELPDNALFDVASITKFFTQIVLYNLIKEGYLSFDDEVIDLDPEFVNIGDVTIRDISEFTVQFQTNGRLDEKKSYDEAYDTLHKANSINRGKYNYNDIGMMILKEVMEKVSGKSFEELIDKYIVKKYGLVDTHIIVPNDKLSRTTGSPNASIGKVNDPSAIALGGFSGHAGIFSSNDDLIRLGKSLKDGIIPDDMISKAYTVGYKDNRGVMGNTYTSHEDGITRTYIDRLDNKDTFAVQGSTRTQLNIGKNSISSILLNPGSMSLEDALEIEEKINKQLILQGKSPVRLIKNLVYNDEEFKSYNIIRMIPSIPTEGPITTLNTILILKLRFLDKVIKSIDKNYDKEININKSI